MNYSRFIIFFCFSLIFSNNINSYNSIYNFSKNARIHSLSGIHALSKNIGGLFYQPISNNKNMTGDTYIAYLNQYSNMIKIIQFGYCLRHDKNKNISIGFISRNIENLFNTSNAWDSNDFTVPPQFDEIDYSKITNLKYKDYGFIVSYNKYFNDSILNYKIKPSYQLIESNYAIGLNIDLMFYKNFTKFDIIFGANDLFSYKKWNSGIIENNKRDFFLSNSIIFNNFNVYIEASSIYREKIAIEYNINNMLFCRFGKASNNNLTYGIGLNSNVFEFSYAYIMNNKILGSIYQISLLLKLDGLSNLKDKLSS